jgi:hypothetical protein
VHSMRDKLNVFEKQILLETLGRSNWARKPAAAALGIDARNPLLLSEEAQALASQSGKRRPMRLTRRLRRSNAVEA